MKNSTKTQINTVSPFNSTKTFTVIKVRGQGFKITQSIAGQVQSECFETDIKRVAEMTYCEAKEVRTPKGTMAKVPAQRRVSFSTGSEFKSTVNDK